MGARNARPGVTRPFRVGVQLPEVERRVAWDDYVAMARTAEEVGFDSVWLGDHLLYRDDGREERGPWDAWSLLAGLAAVTEHVQLGPLVACTAFAPAALLARKSAAVQEISAGRLVLGLGAGWNRAEFEAFGLPFDRRAARFIEAFEVIRRLLEGEKVRYAGEFTHVVDAVVLPMPQQRPPLMVGSIGERVLRATLPYVEAWNCWCAWFGNTPEGFAEQNARVTHLAQEVQRDPSTIVRTATVFVALGDGDAGRANVDLQPITGSATTIADRLRGFQAAGVNEVILVVTPITDSSIRRLGEVVQLVT
jgi:alkanesulfonate monooxygenase SsuD/methylene tetrahydromethanopterin reductase-like flavin-dependent oxidoreductase (luciferase family)